MTFRSGLTVDMRVERVEEPAVFGFTWRLPDLPEDDPRRTYVEFTLEAVGAGTRLRVVETGFAQLPDDSRRKTYDSHAEGWARDSASWRATWMPPDVEAIAEQVFTALADPTRRAILATLAAQGPATATDLADRLPITPPGDRQAPRPAGRCRPGDPRTRRAAAGPLPAPLRARAGGPTVPGRVGPRLGRPSRGAQRTTSTGPPPFSPTTKSKSE